MLSSNLLKLLKNSFCLNQVPLTSTDPLVDEMTYLMFRFEELKESFYCPEKCAKAFPSCQKGYDQLGHGMLQIIKLQRSVVRTKEDLDGIKKIVSNFGSVRREQVKLWSLHLNSNLKKLSEWCERMSSTLCNVTEPDNRMYNNFENNFDLAALKKEAGKVRVILMEYAKSVDVLKMALTNETNLFDSQAEIVRENVGKIEKSFKELAAGHPEMMSGILLQLVSLHSSIISKIGQMQQWKSTNHSNKRDLPQNLIRQFEKNLKSASTLCLVSLQETSKSVKKLEIVDENEESGFMISSYDRSVVGLKSLKVSSIFSDFQSLSGFIDLCEQQNFNIQPLQTQVKMFAPVFEVYVDYVETLFRHSQSMGLISCRYLAQCAHVLKAFLLYDFGKIEQEEGKEGKFNLISNIVLKSEFL